MGPGVFWCLTTAWSSGHISAGARCQPEDIAQQAKEMCQQRWGALSDKKIPVNMWLGLFLWGVLLSPEILVGRDLLEPVG